MKVSPVVLPPVCVAHLSNTWFTITGVFADFFCVQYENSEIHIKPGLPSYSGWRRRSRVFDCHAIYLQETSELTFTAWTRRLMLFYWLHEFSLSYVILKDVFAGWGLSICPTLSWEHSISSKHGWKFLNFGINIHLDWRKVAGTFSKPTFSHNSWNHRLIMTKLELAATSIWFAHANVLLLCLNKYKPQNPRVKQPVTDFHCSFIIQYIVVIFLCVCIVCVSECVC